MRLDVEDARSLDDPPLDVLAAVLTGEREDEILAPPLVLPRLRGVLFDEEALADEVLVVLDVLLLDGEEDVLALLLLDDPEVLLLDDDVFDGLRSALSPDPVSRAMPVSYGVTVTVPTAPVALSDPIHISSSRTTVSTPALENTMPGTRP